MKPALFLFLMISFPIIVTAQRNENSGSGYKYKREVTIDATAVIGNLLSLSSERARSPYGFGYRRHFKKFALRLSGNTLFTTDESSEFNGIDFIQRKLIEQDHNLRLAFEKGIDVANNFRLLYSFDIMVGYKVSESSTDIGFARTDTDFTMGVGPALRLEYKISDRFFLTTESTLYAKYILSYDKFQLGVSPEQTNTSGNYNILLALPTSLTFSVGF